MPGFGACRIDQMAQKWKDFADCSAISPSLAITTAKASAKQFRVKLIKYLADICNFQCYARDPGSHELTELQHCGMPNTYIQQLCACQSVQNLCRIHKNSAPNLEITCAQASILGTESRRPYR